MVVRVVGSRIASGDSGRPLIRNLIFNVPRQFGKTFWSFLILYGKTIPNLSSIFEDLWQMAALTIFLHFVDYSWLKSVRYLWAYSLMEYLITVPFTFVTWFNIVHKSTGPFDGAVVYLVAFLVL